MLNTITFKLAHIDFVQLHVFHADKAFYGKL